MILWEKSMNELITYMGLFASLGSFSFFWPCHEACGILVPRSGIQPRLPALEAWSLNDGTAREVPVSSL